MELEQVIDTQLAITSEEKTLVREYFLERDSLLEYVEDVDEDGVNDD